MALVSRKKLATLAFGLVLALAGSARAQDDAAMLEKGVQFLVSGQNKDGSYGPPGGAPGEIGITALVARALHEAKGTDGNAELAKGRAAAVEKAVAWLLSQQQKDGSFTQERSGLTTYRTSMTILALASIDKAKHKETIEKARKWLESAQFGEAVGEGSPHFGGWGYDKKGENPDADLSNAQMAIAALQAAGVAADDPVLKRALTIVTRCQNYTETNKGVPGAKLVPQNDGGLFYGPSRATVAHTKVDGPDGTFKYDSYASMTYAGLVSMAAAGLTADDPRVKAALGWIGQHYTWDENAGLGARAPDPKQARLGLFYFYYTASRALATLGKPELETKDGKKSWARDLLDALKARQLPNGSWTNEADRWMEGLPVLATAYAVSAANHALPFAPKK